MILTGFAPVLSLWAGAVMAGFAAVPEIWAGCEEAVWLAARRPPTPEIEATMASVTTASSLRWETRFLGLVLLGWESESDIFLSSSTISWLLLTGSLDLASVIGL